MYRIKVPGEDGNLKEVKTPEGDPLHGSTSSLGLDIKQLDEREMSFWAVASTETQDREGDILTAKGWELDNFRKVPVGLWTHDSWSPPIFKSLETKVTKKQLLFNPKFVDEEFGRFVFNLYKDGFMKAFSVGFRFLDWEWIKEIDEEGVRRYIGRRSLKQELFEISAVNVGANPEALALIKSKGGVISEYDASPEPVEKGFFEIDTEHCDVEGDKMLVDIGGGVYKEVIPEDEGLITGFRFYEDEWDVSRIKTWALYYPHREDSDGTKLILPWEGGGKVAIKKIEIEKKEDEKQEPSQEEVTKNLLEAANELSTITGSLKEIIDSLKSDPDDDKPVDVKKIVADFAEEVKACLVSVAEEISALQQVVALKGEEVDEKDVDTKGTDELDKKDFTAEVEKAFASKVDEISTGLKALLDGVKGKLKD